MKIKVMGLLKGHINVATLVVHDAFDMGHTKEALLVMDCYEKSLVSALESRGNGYNEKMTLLIFRDVCNAIFGMHGKSPPIAHRYAEICICKKQSTLYTQNIIELSMMHVLSSVKWFISAVFTVLCPGIIKHTI
jgi:hypothetical protein